MDFKDDKDFENKLDKIDEIMNLAKSEMLEEKASREKLLENSTSLTEIHLMKPPVKRFSMKLYLTSNQIRKILPILEEDE